MKKIPMTDLSLQYGYLKGDILKKFKELCKSSNFILGEEVEKFEQEFAKYCGRKYAIGVSSGTSALHIALEALGCRDKEIISTPLTFIATAEAIIHSGAKIKWVDIDPETYNINTKNISSLVGSDTKAILPVHLYGHPCKMEEIMRIARKYNLNVVEDCAQAHGSEIETKKVGGFGDIGCFSFYPGKNLGAYGDGGCVVCDNSEIAEKIKRLRTHGSLDKYYHTDIGYNYRLDAIQAGILRIKLKYLDSWNEARVENARLYTRELRGTPVTVPTVKDGFYHVFHQYVILAPERDKLRVKLHKDGISTAVHYPIPVHLQPSFSFLGYKEGDFPVAEKISKSCLSLPMYPELDQSRIEYIVKKIKEFYGK
ncbi:MAG: DegT/DnrJ/EryC1/StrS family aminotransferase [Elusimicrobiota bacterium]